MCEAWTDALFSDVTEWPCIWSYCYSLKLDVNLTTHWSYFDQAYLIPKNFKCNK